MFGNLNDFKPDRIQFRPAARLLHRTWWRVGDIVVYVGYVDMSSFTRLFRQWCDINPSRFRERVRAAKRRAGAIPCDIFAWHFWRRFWRGELSLDEARELLAYFKKLYGAPPRERL